MSVAVRVPASTSNLGGGFDCLGIAVCRWLSLDASLAKDSRAPVTLTLDGTLIELARSTEEDLIYRGFAAACGAAGRQTPGGLVLHASSGIPVARGLGSSAAALVAGAVAANALLQLGLTESTVAAVCGEIEGHGDNVGACLRGGAVFTTHAPDGSTILAPVEVADSLNLAFAVPDFPVDTLVARAALPTAIPHTDARRAAAASAALVLGLASGDPALLAAGLEGPLHIAHRQPLVRGYDAVVAAARDAGALGATLSGSGSSIVALATADHVPHAAAAMEAAWRGAGVAALSFVSVPCRAGCQVELRGHEVAAGSHASANSANAAHISNSEENT